ncbi:MAG: zinc ABC transporter substrate-binding protein [Dehalococcoidia bacterium]
MKKKLNEVLNRPFCVLAYLLLGVMLVASVISSGVACKGDDSTAGGRIGIVVTILPQVEFVENVGGEKVSVTVMIPSGASPHTYEPKPSQIRGLAEAEMYAKIGSGIDFELTWMDNLIEQNRNMLVVDCSDGVELIEAEGSSDPHIWMSPVNAQKMVRNICDGLIEIDPENRDFYEANYDAYIQEIAKADRGIREALTGIENRSFMVYHPAFGYFADEYGLTMMAVEEEGKEPAARSLADLIDEAREQGIKVIFVEPQFNPKSAEVVAHEIGGRVVAIDPLAEDYIANLSRITNCIVEAAEGT